MAGYAAAMRVERIEIRGRVAARPERAKPEAADAAEVVSVIELTGRQPGERLRQRLEDVRVYVGQLTWYLFDAEGWR